MNGKRWSGDAARHRFQTCTRTGQLAQGIGVADWRHISVAFMRKHSRVDQEEGGDEVMDLQAGHSTQTALAVYGVSMTDMRSMGAQQLEAYAEVSRLWHGFLGLKSRPLPVAVAEQGQVRVPLPEVPLPVAVPCEAAQVYHNSWDKLPQPNAGTIECLRAVYPGAFPRSVEQGYALEFLRAGRNDGIIVLPTGAGKTALMLCAAKEGRGKTILFSPLVALKHDIQRRAREAEVRLEICPVETAHRTLESLKRRQDLDRIIFDEAHLVLTHASFRDFSALNVPTILMTATLPAGQEADLAAAFLMYSHHVIRARTNRPNLKYAVMQGNVIEYIQGLRLTGEDRAIVFCRMKLEVMRLKDMLQATYCTGALSEDEKLEQVGVCGERG